MWLQDVRLALRTLRKAWDAGFKDVQWARRDPELTLLHGEPEFDKMYPPDGID